MKPDYSFKLTQKVDNYITEQKMLRHGDSVIIGLSGGADSVCLFLLLNKLQKNLDLDLHVVHVNHGIRGESANNDEQFSKCLCEKYDIPFKAYHVDIPSLAKEKGLTVEEAGRNARYEIFSLYAKELSENVDDVKIAVAHHMDDQAETVVFNMARGSGLKGMSGMAPVNVRTDEEESTCIIRPLLCLTKNEILKYLECENQEYCVDETNSDNDYSRNQIRNAVMPSLTYLQPKTAEHIANMADDVRTALEYINEEIETLYKRAVTVDNQSYRILVKDIKNMNSYIVKELFIYVLRKMILTYKDITKTHINDIYSLISKGKGKRIILPYDIVAEREKEYIVFKREKNEI